MHIYVFGDQTYDVADTLHTLSSTHDDPLVTDFLQRSCGLLKHELACLPAQQKAKCPRFATIPDLISSYRAGTLNPALVQALTCIAQLGIFIRQHSSGGYSFPRRKNSCLVGSCTGSLTAAAISCARSCPSLLPAALHAVAVAIRLGALAWDVADRIGGTSPCSAESSDSWAVAVVGPSLATVSDALQKYATQAALPVVTRPYVAATVSAFRCSVSGPPHVLQDFLAFSAELWRPAATATATVATATPLRRISAPYHTSHLYSEADIDHVVAGVPHLEHGASIPVMSATADGPPYSTTPSSLRDALAEAARDCLLRRTALDTLALRIVDRVNQARQPGAGDKQDVVLHHIAWSGEERLLSVVRSLLAPHSCVVRSECSPASLPMNSPLGSAGAAAKSPIAILSASGRFPGRVDSMDAFWDILYRGADTHEMVPPSRWDASAHVGDPSAKNVSGTGYGCWLHQAGQFDVAFFNMSPREAAQVDPAQRLALLTATEALEQAGIVPDRTPSTQKHRVGVWFGSTSNDWMETNSAQNIDTYFIPGGNRAFIPGRINYHFKFSGPSYSIDTACSSSLAALQLACNALWRGEVDTAIVGGANVLTNPDITTGLDRGHFLSRTGNCKTFDDNADGYCRGEAVATVVLKRLDDARLDNDPVQACILGVATNHNAEAESITRPCAAAQQELFEHLLAETSISAKDVSYVEMHGTGTQAGDADETIAVVSTLCPMTARGSCRRSAINPLYIGAVKSNVGHGEAAAGVTSLAKTLLMLKHSIIPPHTGIKTTINHRLPDLQAHNTRIANVPTPWPRPSTGPRRILLNNFSAAGGNTALVLEDPPLDNTVKDVDPRRHHIVTVSAKTPDSLTSNLRNLIIWVRGQGQREDPSFLPKLSYTSTARRMHHRHRVAFSTPSTGQLLLSLQDRLDSLTNGQKIVPIPAKAPGFVFAFTGQGSGTHLGADMYAQFASYRADVQRYDRLCTQMGFPSIVPLFQQPETSDGPTPTLLQLAHVCCQMALSRLWTSFGIGASLVVGHSLGEYAALYAAGVLSQADVIYLVGTRAQLMECHLSADSHAMLVIMASEIEVLAALPGQLGQDYEIACRNGAQNVVLGGTRAQIENAWAVLAARGMRCHHLRVPLAFHTSQVDPILDTFHSLSRGVSIRNPKIPVISPTAGSVLHHANDFDDGGYFVRHCRNAVNIMDAIGVATADGLLHDKIIAIEMGSSPVVARLVKDVVGPSMQTFASIQKNMDTWELFTEGLAAMYMAGAIVDWTKYHADFPQSHEVLQLPTYCWALKEYWMQYVHDWSLRKGDAPIAATPACDVRAAPNLHTTSIHRVVKNNLASDHDGEVVLDIDVNEEDARSMVQGHKVYGVPLCTPSVYADIVLMIGMYAKEIYGLDLETVATEVVDMNIKSALVTNEVGREQVLRVAVKFDAAGECAACTFSSINHNGEVIEQHANCQLRFTDIGKARAELNRAAAAARSSMKALHDRVGEEGNTFRFSQAMIYKMIGQLAAFDPKYQGLSAIILDNDTLEATGTISFQDIPDDGKWFMNPAYLDSLTQTGGFVMNANNGVDLETEVFVNHGWGSLQLFVSKLKPKAMYKTYVKMSEGNEKLWVGDIFIFDGNDQLVGLVSGVALQRVPKRLMEYVVRFASQKVCGGPKALSLTPGVLETTRPTKIVSLPAHLGTTRHAKAVARPGTLVNPREVVTAAQQAALASPPAFPEPDSTEKMAPECWSTAMQILSAEIGVPEKDLNDDVDLADIGVDSLLSLVLCGRFRDELDVDIPERDLYMECHTIADIKQRVCEAWSGVPWNDDTQSKASAERHHSLTLSSERARGRHLDELILGSSDTSRTLIPPAWSVYLQGSPKRSTKTLFLFPDGCGASTSYLGLPEISRSTAVVGFNSPFMRTPGRMYEYTLQEVLQSYIAGLRGRQAHGPYHLGGWSAGGILAYAIARELFAQGEHVASLTLIDSPPPNHGLDRLPDRFFDHCGRVGLFGTKTQRGSFESRTPEWLMPHFRATIDMLHDYHAPPMPVAATRNMQVHVIWAEDCAFNGFHYPHLPLAMTQGEDTEGMKFLSEQRQDFGPGAWAELLLGAHVRTNTVEAEHHFSMMRDGGAQRLVEYIREDLGGSE